MSSSRALGRGTNHILAKKNNSDHGEIVCKRAYGFKMVGAKLNREQTFQIRKLVTKHTFERAYHTKNIGGKWISETFMELI